MNDTEKKPRVTLCVPHTEFMPSVFVHSLMALWAHSYWIHQISWGNGSDASAARNWCVEQYPPHTTDYYLFIDSDMGFPHDALDRLLTAKKNLVSGLCFQKHEPFRPCIYRIDSIGQLEFVYNFEENKLFSIDAAGAALMLVKADIFDRLSKHNPAWHKKWFAWEGHSEDITFYIRAKEIGEQAWCDSSLIADHFTMAPRGIENFKDKQKDIRNNKKDDGEYYWPDGSKFDLAKFHREMIIPPIQEEKETPPGYGHLEIDREPIFKGPDVFTHSSQDRQGISLKNLSALRLKNNNHSQSGLAKQPTK